MVDNKANLISPRRKNSVDDIDGGKVKGLRIEKGWTQGEVGELAGICAALVGKIELHSVAIRRRTLVGLGRAFTVEPDSLRVGRELVVIPDRSPILEEPKRKIGEIGTEKLEEILSNAQRTIRIVSRELERRRAEV